ncbi:MAG TPA: CorA family divalent cation transporter [Chloroflexota bacterium]|nr:CorA family divalent cation transporter [Chloroflexota bacterium]
MVTDSPSVDSNVRSVTAHGVTWLSVDRPTSAELELVARDYGIEQADLAQGLDRNAATGSWRRDSYVAIVLQLPSPTGGQSRSGQTTTLISLFVGVEFVATVHVGDIRPLLRLMRECETVEAIREEVFRDGPGGLMLAIFGRLLDIFDAARARVERAIGPDAEAMFDSSGQGFRLDTVALATRLRLEVRVIRRLVLSLRESLQLYEREAPKLEATALPWIRIRRRVEHLIQSIEDDLLGLDGLVSAAEASATLETAREQRVLTAIVGLTLPVMAVAAVLALPGGNPLTSGPNGYAYALGIVGIVFLVALFIMQRRGNL